MTTGLGGSSPPHSQLQVQYTRHTPDHRPLTSTYSVPQVDFTASRRPTPDRNQLSTPFSLNLGSSPESRLAQSLLCHAHSLHIARRTPFGRLRTLLGPSCDNPGSISLLSIASCRHPLLIRLFIRARLLEYHPPNSPSAITATSFWTVREELHGSGPSRGEVSFGLHHSPRCQAPNMAAPTRLP